VVIVVQCAKINVNKVDPLVYATACGRSSFSNRDRFAPLGAKGVRH
jgi:hypothetical protein